MVVVGGSTIPLSWAVMTMAHHCQPPPTPTLHRLGQLHLARNRPSTPWIMAPRCRSSHSRSRSRSTIESGPCPARGTTPRAVGVRCTAPPWSTTTRPRQPTMMANHSNVVILEIPDRPCPLRRRPTTTMRTTTVCPRRPSSTSPPPMLRISFKNAPNPGKWPPPLRCLTTSTVEAPSRST